VEESKSCEACEGVWGKCLSMKQEQLQHYRDQLLAQRRDVAQDTQRHGQIPSERVDAEDNDFADQANVAVERELTHRIAESEDHLLEKIDLALARIDAETYGTCASCGGTIPVERLNAKPSVSLCLSCQTQKEG
jgi:DnaK suppressor protein